jgi:hypothetical protein
VSENHGLHEGRRYPATPEDQRSAYEVVCLCRRTFSGYSWDDALDAFLDHLAGPVVA